MWVNKERCMIYLASPRTGSQATRETLKLIGFDRCGAHHKPLSVHPGKEWTVFTTVRNPWDLWVSWWFGSRGKAGPFSVEWLEKWRRRQELYYPHRGKLFHIHTQYADRILRFETLHADLNDLFGFRVLLTPVNVSAGRKGCSYRKLYEGAPGTREYVAEHYAEEIERFGYKY